MFVLKQSSTFTWPVKVLIPVDGGKFDTQTFDAEFKRLDKSYIEEILDKVEKGETTDISFCKEVLVGWKGIQGEGGAQVPFSESARDQLLEVNAVSSAIVNSFLNAISGGKLKN